MGLFDIEVPKAEGVKPAEGEKTYTVTLLTFWVDKEGEEWEPHTVSAWVNAASPRDACLRMSENIYAALRGRVDARLELDDLEIVSVFEGRLENLAPTEDDGENDPENTGD